MLNLQFIQTKIQESHLSYRQLSLLLGFNSSATVWKWAHGRNQIKATKLAELAELLEEPIQSFFEVNCDDQSPIEGGDCL